ncbi:MAG: hypothetical protein Q9166_002794 [cf. Caloplaca sp. 2 TL-2023]
MAKDKDRTLNPAAAQLKADKARALKKGKAAITAQRNERLAQRNPSRLERQIADLKSLAESSSTGGLNARDKKQLEELERQLGAVKKAREKVGARAPTFGGSERGGRSGERGRGRGGGVLGKRSRGFEEQRESSGSETDESVRRIPMPRDTPPPIPSQHRHGRGRGGSSNTFTGNGRGNANMEPLGEGRERITHGLPPKPETSPAVVTAKTTYEAKPVVRDLRKEAVKAFMPAVVARKVAAVKGGGGRLLEEEEVERLEREGYLGGGKAGDTKDEADGEGDGVRKGVGRGIAVDAAPRILDDAEEKAMDDEERRKMEDGIYSEERNKLLEEEEERFRREVRMEEVSDEDV